MPRKPTIKELLRKVSLLQEENRRLKERMTRFENLIENAGIPIGVYDPDGVVLMINKSGAANLGGVPQDFIGRRMSEFIQGNTDIYVQRIKKAIETAVPEEHEDEASLPVGRKWFHSTYNLVKDGTDRIFGVQINSIDITERKRAEEKLRETRDLLTSILDNVPALIYVNTIDNRYRLVNKAWERFVGKTQEEVEGRIFEEVFSPRIAQEFRTVNQEVVERGTVVTVEESLVRPQGKVVFHTVKFPLRDAAGRIEVVCGISIDITERKLAEEALRKSQKLLFQAQKMESLGTLVAGMAHEINNPINLIMFNVPLLQKVWRDIQPILEKHALHEPHKKYGGLTANFLKQDLDRLLRDTDLAANRVATIVSGLKDFAKMSDIRDKTPIQINEAVTNAMRLAQTTLKKVGIDVELELGQDLPLIEGNLQCLEQIVLNLIVNASQAIGHENGRIRVKTGLDETKGQIVVVVSDNGKGIDPSTYGQIFDPFFTTRQADGGTGLGLAVTYSVAKAHDGEITFESGVGRGTTFTVTLPATLEGKRARILVADDEETLRDIIVHVLERDPGYSVEQASTGSEALLKIETFRPDLMILDVFMPDTDGLEVCRVLKKDPRLSGIKVIIITGHADDPKLDQIKRLGFEQILEKPLRMGAVLNEARKMLGESAEEAKAKAEAKEKR